MGKVEKLKGTQAWKTGCDDNCPKCGHTATAANSVSQPGAEPRDGDLTLCINCAAILVFERQKDTSLKRREVTPTEFDQLDEVTRFELRRAQEKVELIQRARQTRKQ